MGASLGKGKTVINLGAMPTRIYNGGNAVAKKINYKAVVRQRAKAMAESVLATNVAFKRAAYENLKKETRRDR
jgi:hypothetical protein